MSTNRELISRNIQLLIESNLIQPKDKIVIAVSGGMDSMFLLHLLVEFQKTNNIELIIGHVNHNIRNNSINDEIFVLEQGRKYGIKTIVKQLDFNVKKKNESTEAWARNNRYRQIELIRDEYNFNKIATAHHGNDQIETILQRLSEKSGIGGLRGIYTQRGNIIRPILSLSKNDIKMTVNNLGIEYINDETNLNLKITRNYFRHKVIPAWERQYPNLANSIDTICESAGENQIVIDYFIEKLIDDIVIKQDDQLSDEAILQLARSKFDVLPLAVKKSLINNLISNDPWRKNQWEELEKILASAKVGKIYNIGDFEILKDRKDWIIRHKFKVISKSVKIDLNKTVKIGNTKILVKEISNISQGNDHHAEIVDGKIIIGKKLQLRTWQKGDYFQPIGMSGRKKVSDFLIDEKVNLFEKEKQLVLTADDEIIWVCGRRISDKVRINENTKQFLELSIKD